MCQVDSAFIGSVNFIPLGEDKLDSEGCGGSSLVCFTASQSVWRATTFPTSFTGILFVLLNVTILTFFLGVSVEALPPLYHYHLVEAFWEFLVLVSVLWWYSDYPIL